MAIERRIYKLRRFTCAGCGATVERLQWGHDPAPDCTDCSTQMTPEWYLAQKSTSVIGDEIDITLEHGLPGRRFRSRQEMNRALKEAGLVPAVRWAGPQDEHVTRWI
jgi:hypothetical protein